MCDCKVRLERLERWADKVKTALRDLSGRIDDDYETSIPSLLDEQFNDSDNKCDCPCHVAIWKGSRSCINCGCRH